MKKLLLILSMLSLLSGLLAACGGQSAPVLPAENSPTLVYIYTEG